ncbi:11780_t:CDS:2 [Acaulospora colombiana]|uniref:11780_t:CDS:1 n=1 Tax=Acaulospora colombiana TaxID=27376 RepID=A0ACA9P686_9GLOM|nr:11780_t:CDS:2 [Acaulospora colombiana]
MTELSRPQKPPMSEKAEILSTIVYIHAQTQENMLRTRKNSRHETSRKRNLLVLNQSTTQANKAITNSREEDESANKTDKTGRGERETGHFRNQDLESTTWARPSRGDGDTLLGSRDRINQGDCNREERYDDLNAAIGMSVLWLRMQRMKSLDRKEHFAVASTPNNHIVSRTC